MANRWPLATQASSRRHRPPPGDCGHVYIEYLIVVAAIGLVAAAAFASLGPRIVANYIDTRGILLSINP